MIAGDPFYVGYQPRAPERLARHLRLVVAGLMGVGALIAAAVIVSHGPFAAATFEFGHPRDFVGVIVEHPAPALVVGAPEGSARLRLLLASTGKHGAAEEVAGLDGRAARLRGTLVYRGGRTLVEVVPGSVRPSDGGGTAPSPSPESLGRHVLRGEIVDIKCFLGVMNPGRGKTHRACAARCISGGVPPVLVVEDEEGREGYLLLVGLDGAPIGRLLLDRIAEPVEATGTVERFDDLLVLFADPADIERVD